MGGAATSPQPPPKALGEDLTAAALWILTICTISLLSSFLLNLSLDALRFKQGGDRGAFRLIVRVPSQRHVSPSRPLGGPHTPKAATNLTSYKSSGRPVCCGSTRWSTCGRVTGGGGRGRLC